MTHSLSHSRLVHSTAIHCGSVPPVGSHCLREMLNFSGSDGSVCQSDHVYVNTLLWATWTLSNEISSVIQPHVDMSKCRPAVGCASAKTTPPYVRHALAHLSADGGSVCTRRHSLSQSLSHSVSHSVSPSLTNLLYLTTKCGFPSCEVCTSYHLW